MTPRRSSPRKSPPRCASQSRCCSAMGQPLLFLYLFGSLLDGAMGSSWQWFVPGILVMMSLTAPMSSGYLMLVELLGGSMERLMVTPLNRTAMLVGQDDEGDGGPALPGRADHPAGAPAGLPAVSGGRAGRARDVDRAGRRAGGALVRPRDQVRAQREPVLPGHPGGALPDPAAVEGAAARWRPGPRGCGWSDRSTRSRTSSRPSAPSSRATSPTCPSCTARRPPASSPRSALWLGNRAMRRGV